MIKWHTKIRWGLWFSSTFAKWLSSCICRGGKKWKMSSDQIILFGKSTLSLYKNRIWFSLCSFWDLIYEHSFNLHFVKSYKLAFTISSFIFWEDLKLFYFLLIPILSALDFLRLFYCWLSLDNRSLLYFMIPQNDSEFLPCYYGHSSDHSDAVKYQCHGKEPEISF